MSNAPLNRATKSKRVRSQRERWFREHPYCCYCRVKLTLPKYTDKRGPRKATDATIEHLRPRGHPERHEPNPFGIVRHALCCRACNDKQNLKFMQAKTLEEIWRINGMWERMAMTTGALPSEVCGL